METLWIKFPRFHYLPTIIYIGFPKKSHDIYNKSPTSKSSSESISLSNLS